MSILDNQQAKWNRNSILDENIDAAMHSLISKDIREVLDLIKKVGE